MTRRSIFWSSLSAWGIALLAISAFQVKSPVLLYNPSESAPLGWYRVEPIDAISRDDLVVARLPKDASELAVKRGYLPTGVPVIKAVFGVEGDVVCEADGVLLVNGYKTVSVLKHDRSGRPLASPWSVCRGLGSDEVLLLSNWSPASYDGRYFGAVQEREIVGRAVWISGAKKQHAAVSGGEVGEERECKIKAHGANRGRLAGLHIDFDGSMDEDAAPCPDEIPSGGNRPAWFYSAENSDMPPEKAE